MKGVPPNWLPPRGQRAAIAVSGGPDSLALLLLAAVAAPGRIHALTVDHALRPDSADEAAAVAAICAARGIPHTTLCWTGPKPASNIQAAARTARYALMADWCAANGVPALMTAHHADDQAETLLMRLARGSGVGGLSGIRPGRGLGRGVTLVRPLLGVRKADLLAIVAAAGLTPADDPANRDPRHDRTAARAALAAVPWLDPVRLAASAERLAEAEAALDWTTERAWAGRAEATDGLITLDPHGLPAELVYRLTARAIAAVAPDAAPRGEALARLIARLTGGGSGTIAGVRVQGGALWRFSAAAARRHA